MLMFRVGRFDETLPTSGITHLVEHLALSELAAAKYQLNGEVSGRFTTFLMESASPPDVADFVAAVCQGLAADHPARLEQEKRVLRTEAASRGGSGALGTCLIERYGATGPGLAGYEEFGLRTLGWDQVVAWRCRWFVAGNAVLCILGEVPVGLRIELPRGEPPEMSPLRPSAVRLPGFTVAGRGGLGMSLVGGASPESTVVLDVLQRRLMTDLRHDRGLSYDVKASGELLDATLRHAWLAPDALAEQAAMAAHVMLATFEKLADTGSTAEEIADCSRRLQDAYQSPSGPVMVMHRQAQRILASQPARDPGETLRRIGDLTGDDITAAARDLYGQMIVATPTFLPAVHGRMARLPEWSAAEIQGGVSYRARDSAATLAIGDVGVMLTPEPGRFVSVPSDQVAALLMWNDGKQMLVGTDGFSVHIDPAEWDGAGDALRRLGSSTDPALIVAIDSAGPARKRPPAPPAPAPGAGGDAAAVPASRGPGRARVWLPLIVVGAWLVIAALALLAKAVSPPLAGIVAAVLIATASRPYWRRRHLSMRSRRGKPGTGAGGGT